MANNRMFLKCEICGELFMLAKSYGDGFYVSGFDKKEFDKFLQDHTWCTTEKLAGDEGNFSIDYEIKPEKPVTTEELERQAKGNEWWWKAHKEITASIRKKKIERGQKIMEETGYGNVYTGTYTAHNSDFSNFKCKKCGEILTTIQPLPPERCPYCGEKDSMEFDSAGLDKE